MTRLALSWLLLGAWAREPKAPAKAPLLPGSLIVTYYGNPLSKRMGILGEIAPEKMLDRLAGEAARWRKADASATVRPALELVAIVASEFPGPDRMYRTRMQPELIDRVHRWAKSRGWLLILDIQVGRSNVKAELASLLPWLRLPDVHLALDPEFHMRRGLRPGQRIGSSDAEDVNVAIIRLAELVERHRLPPKLLLVHRFTDGMLRRHRRVRLDPRVQVVMLMDGFGQPAAKRRAYRRVITREPVQFSGIKLFYKNDRPMMSTSQVLGLDPKPRVIIYQ
ncbi:MAG: hypothetical protein HY553_18185 [Elusimicrobia bacterium]|nr:hypothetical protein [Elusimicrobiota bacterium]